MSSGGHQYGYLALKRNYGGLITFPGGDQKAFDTHEEAEASWQKWVEEKGLPEATRKAEEKRRAFIEGAQVTEERVKQPGLLSADKVFKRVHDAEGNYLGDATDAEFEVIVENAAIEKFPAPKQHTVAEELGAEVKKLVAWAVALYLDGERRERPAIWRWDFGFPIEDTLAILNELAAEGWEIVNVSEDRGIYKGVTNLTDSAVTTVRYLLVRRQS